MLNASLIRFLQAVCRVVERRDEGDVFETFM